MTETAIINGVELTEEQLLDGLAQIKAAKSTAMYVDSGCLQIPVAVVRQMQAQADKPCMRPGSFVVLYPNGTIGWNGKKYPDFTPLKGFTS